MLTPETLFFNTGMLKENPDLSELDNQTEHSDFKFNDFVVFDEH